MLTDAERRTGAYSNRFAGHIVKQHQLMALAPPQRLDGDPSDFGPTAPNDEPTRIVLPRHGSGRRILDARAPAAMIPRSPKRRPTSI